MECKKCGIENDDSAVYCKSCGSRLDGKIKCPGCGEYNDEGSAFCVHCGARIDGKKPCPDAERCPTENSVRRAELLSKRKKRLRPTL